MPNGTNDNYIEKIVQNESHDWFGDAAENYVRYLFAREGFIVFANSKWGADCTMYHKDNPKRWWRVEVRSTDRNRNPKPKKAKKLKQIADLVAEVRLKQVNGINCFTVNLFKVNKEGRYRRHQITIGDLIK